MSEEASECRRGPEGGLNVQRAADQADLLAETFDIGQHQQLLFIDLCACGDGGSSFLAEYPSCDCMWVSIYLEHP